jgi:hypothetical protein
MGLTSPAFLRVGIHTHIRNSNIYINKLALLKPPTTQSYPLQYLHHSPTNNTYTTHRPKSSDKTILTPLTNQNHLTNNTFITHKPKPSDYTILTPLTNQTITSIRRCCVSDRIFFTSYLIIWLHCQKTFARCRQHCYRFNFILSEKSD